ncbi:MAG: sigma 54-interacting transcriptional regulator [Acidobacteriaceae bacterium]|nr:sigma 54-interacting transcriptional regulator [Acidobacteriaceae bacterium]MBV9501997.1 sigma 54-interacting transcriptional regulator [Acidobacteriaceae bacterium]
MTTILRVTRDADGLQEVIGRATLVDSRSHFQPTADVDSWRQSLIGNGNQMRRVCDTIQLVASRRCTVLITGETGTGKEVVARAIHGAGARAKFPIVALNCTALPASLIEAELFGHAKGAFTGAHMSRAGFFEQANRGSIFLDEIGELPLEAQAKLLRVLQDQEFQRIGGTETIRIDVRVIAASNVDLGQAVKERKFREDLYYRLNVVSLHLPPLRDRRDDIPLLLDHFLEKVRLAEKMSPKQISPEAVGYLQSLDWPGNVRQLEHAVHKAFALSGDRDTLTLDDFDWKPGFRQHRPSIETEQLIGVPETGLDFEQVVAGFELSLLNQALTLSGGNKARAAELLRIKRTTLLAKLKSFEERRVAKIEPLHEVERCPRTSQGTVLIVERDLAVRKMIASTLREQNYRVLESGTISRAAELLDCWKTHIRLVVCSSDMSPSGEEGALKQAAEGLPWISIRDRQSYPQPFSKSQSDYNAVLFRPFTPEDLVALVTRITAGPDTALRSEWCA